MVLNVYISLLFWWFHVSRAVILGSRLVVLSYLGAYEFTVVAAIFFVVFLFGVSIHSSIKNVYIAFVRAWMVVMVCTSYPILLVNNSY